MMLEQYISLAEASKICPNRPGVPSLWRWCRKGIKAKGGGQVYLQHARAGAKIFTTEQWLDDFFAAIAKADHAYFANSSTQKPVRVQSTPHQRKEAIAQAEAQLARAGI